MLPVKEEERRKENIKYDLILQHSWTYTHTRAHAHSLSMDISGLILCLYWQQMVF